MMLSEIRHEILTQYLAQRFTGIAQTKHFILYKLKPGQKTPIQVDDLIVVHNFEASEIDNNIGYFVVNELLPVLAELRDIHLLSPTDGIYTLNEQQIFERYVGAIVCSMDGNETRAWDRFYDNTLHALTKAASCHTDNEVRDFRQDGSEPNANQPGQDFIENFGAIYQCALELLDIGHPADPLTVLDVASCFGFFPLFLVQQQKPRFARVVGCDQNAALVDLANGYTQRQQFSLAQFVIADILATEHIFTTNRGGFNSSVVPFDVVTAIHLLEHLQPQQTETAIANLWKITGRRLIISVPLEEKPDKQFGHQQVFDQQRLSAIAQQLSTSYRYFENRGGWIVIDRPATLTQNPPKRRYHHAKVPY